MKILFASYHCLLDPTSGAALGMRHLLQEMAARGVEVQAFCGARMDRLGVQVANWIEEQRLPHRQQMFQDDSVLFSMIDCHDGNVPVTVYAPEHEMSDPSRDPTDAEVASYVSLYGQLLDQSAPDVVVTYGGSWVGDSLIREAKRRGIKVVFWLRNCAYEDARLFEQVDAIMVPSQFSTALQGFDCKTAAAWHTPIGGSLLGYDSLPEGGSSRGSKEPLLGNRRKSRPFSSQRCYSKPWTVQQKG